MKKSILSLVFMLSGYFMVLAQSGSVIGSQIRIAEKTNGVYSGWTTDWIELSGSQRPVLQITEDTYKDGGETFYVYDIKFTFEGEVTEGIYVYDSEKSAEIRKEWNKRVVNCYVDADGDYMYVEDVSLKELAKNPDAWAKYPNSAIQFINKDMNVAFK